MSFASSTSVTVDRTRAEIEHLVTSHAGRDAEFSYGRMAGTEQIQFVAYGRRVRFTVMTPTREEASVISKRRRRNTVMAEMWIAQESRRRWRCLLLSIRAKLEAVEARISGDDLQTAFDREFLAYVVGPGGKSVYELITSGVGGHGRLLTAAEEATSS